MKKGGILGITHSLVSPKLIYVKSQFLSSWGRMNSNTKIDEKLEGDDNFQAWKYRVMLILEDNDLEGFI